MKNKLPFYIYFGIATGLVVWSFQEMLIYLVSVGVVPHGLKSLLYGALFGLISGGLIGAEEGFFLGSQYRLRRGFGYVGLLGMLGGAVTFYLAEQIGVVVQSMAVTPYMLLIVHALRWVVVALFIGFAMGIRDKSQISGVRGLLSSLVAGVLGGALVTFLMELTIPAFWVRGVGSVVFTTALSAALCHFSTLGRKSWLKVLNGKLEGLDIELLNEIHIIGTQDNDDINLGSYQDVQQAHAKLIQYFGNYSLVDNDPFCQTYVNFRNIKEQFLKNGDILKVGTALFQYCTID